LHLAASSQAAGADVQAEHSLELHMPFLMAAMQGTPFTLVPIVVGAVPSDR
jgi:AmmeMemoRadiSam system protein B